MTSSLVGSEMCIRDRPSSASAPCSESPHRRRQPPTSRASHPRRPVAWCRRISMVRSQPPVALIFLDTIPSDESKHMD
eukprot:621768-Prorocentrum_lima.AAC.1